MEILAISYSFPHAFLMWGYVNGRTAVSYRKSLTFCCLQNGDLRCRSRDCLFHVHWNCTCDSLRRSVDDLCCFHHLDSHDRTADTYGAQLAHFTVAVVLGRRETQVPSLVRHGVDVSTVLEAGDPFALRLEKGSLRTSIVDNVLFGVVLEL